MKSLTSRLLSKGIFVNIKCVIVVSTLGLHGLQSEAQSTQYTPVLSFEITIGNLVRDAPAYSAYVRKVRLVRQDVMSKGPLVGAFTIFNGSAQRIVLIGKNNAAGAFLAKPSISVRSKDSDEWKTVQPVPGKDDVSKTIWVNEMDVVLVDFTPFEDLLKNAETIRVRFCKELESFDLNPRAFP